MSSLNYIRLFFGHDRVYLYFFGLDVFTILIKSYIHFILRYIKGVSRRQALFRATTHVPVVISGDS